MAEIINTAELTYEEIVNIIVKKAKEGKLVARLKSGDFSIYGALNEELQVIKKEGIDYELIPGITAAIAAASSLGIELTLPRVSQTLIITRASVPMEGSIKDYAPFLNKGSSMVIYTGVHIIDKVVEELKEGGLSEDSPIAVVYKATWKGEEKIIKCTLKDIAEKVKKEKITRDAVIVIGKILTPEKYEFKSSAYDENHYIGFRVANQDKLKYFEARYSVDKIFAEEHLKELINALKEGRGNEKELINKMEKFYLKVRSILN